MVTADVHIKKINDRTVTDAVNQVADGTAGNKGQADGVQNILPPKFTLEHQDNHQGNDSHSYKKHLSPPRRMTGKDAECRTGVAQKGQIEQARDNYRGIIQIKILQDPQLAQLIAYHDQQDNDKKPDQDQPARLRTTVAQRLQIEE